MLLFRQSLMLRPSASSTFNLEQARGVVLAVAGLANISVISVATTKVKHALTGTGRATKHQVGEMVRAIYRYTARARIGLKQHTI